MKLLSLFLTLFGCAQSANILGVFMFPSYSHQIIFHQICRELSLRGHQVTMVTTNPRNDPTLTNLTEISIQFAYDVIKQNKFHAVISDETTRWELMKSVYYLLDVVAEAELNSTQFQDLAKRKNPKFDLIFVQNFHSVMYALGERFKAPVITIASMRVFTTMYDFFGNPNHPSLYPEFYFNFRLGTLTLWEKLKSVSFYIWHTFYHRWVVTPTANEMAQKYIGDDVSYIGDLAKTSSMIFVYRNILMDNSRPNVPGVVDMSFINTEKSKSLSEDLQKILDKATEGVIYVSFGTNVKIEESDHTTQSNLLGALKELPYTVLLKWKFDPFPGNSSNVIVRQWFPQRDVLAHPNVRVFVTQGGSQSIEDAIFNAVPLIGMPFGFDQPINIRHVEELGIGEHVDRRTLDKEKFKDLIIKIAESSSYKDNMKRIRDTMLDRSLHGLESVVWWSEYVIRHKGAPHLRSVTVDVSYFQYFLLDVTIFTCILVSVLPYLVYKLMFFFVRGTVKDTKR